MKLLPNNYIFWEALLLTMFHTSFEIHSKKLTPKALSFPLWKMRVCPRKRMSIDTSPFKRIRDFIVEWKSSVLHHKNSVKSLILLDLFRLKKINYHIFFWFFFNICFAITYVFTFFAYKIILLKGDLGICTTNFCLVLLIRLYQTETDFHPIIVLTVPQVFVC